MELPKIDESKLPEVMKIIDDAASLMAETGCYFDEEETAAKKELNALYERLREITGDTDIETGAFQEYWSYTDLETVARQALLGHPQKSGMTDGQLAELVSRIFNLDFGADENETEALNDYFLEVLKVETGLPDISNYIYYPDAVGLDPDAGPEEIAAKILADRK